MKKNKLLLGYVMVILSAVTFGLMPLMTAMIRADAVLVIAASVMIPLIDNMK